MHLQQHETVRWTDSAITLGKVQALDLEAALHHWSEPSVVARLDTLTWSRRSWSSWWGNEPDDQHYLDFVRMRSALVAAFRQRIYFGELVLTGLVAPITLASRREVISPDIVEVLEISFAEATARAFGLKLVRLKVHKVEREMNAGGLAWDGSGAGRVAAVDEFQHNGDYSRAVIRGTAFDLSGGLCQVVARLHEAALSADPWLVGKQVLAQCGYATSFMGDAFKRHDQPSWRELVKGNGRGLYRLNLQHE